MRSASAATSGTWLSRRPAPERRGSPRSTTGACAVTDRTAAVCGPPERDPAAEPTSISSSSSTTPSSARGLSAASAPRGGITSSRRSSRSTGDRARPAQFDVVIVDEFHHAEAETYASSLSTAPAGPPRADRDAGASRRKSISCWFDDGSRRRCGSGRRLRRASLPFHYFGSATAPTSGVGFQRGRYVRQSLRTCLPAITSERAGP